MDSEGVRWVGAGLVEPTIDLKFHFFSGSTWKFYIFGIPYLP